MRGSTTSQHPTLRTVLIHKGSNNGMLRTIFKEIGVEYHANRITDI